MNKKIERPIIEGIGPVHPELLVKCKGKMNKPKMAPWIDGRWNPCVGCTQISEGCKNCWACKNHNRFHHGEKFAVTLIPDRLGHPLKMKPGSHIAVSLMGDIFHKDVSQYMLECVIQAMALAPLNTYFLLTRRPENAINMIAKLSPEYRAVLDTCWIGVSAENQKWFDQRTQLLKDLPGHKFVSCEPLLGPIDNIKAAGAAWIIAGPESGKPKRPCDDKWIDSIVDQCEAEGIPVVDKRKTNKCRGQHRPAEIK